MSEQGRQGPQLLLVDALNLIRRVYAGQPGEDGSERAAAALDSCVQSLRRGLRECSPSHAACIFDGEGPSWRHELFAAYKEGHAPMPDALRATLDDYRRAFAELGVVSLCEPRLEADDVIATIARKAAEGGVAVTILSTDKIFRELIPLGVRVRDHFKREDVEAEDVVRQYGVRPEQLADFLALTGDRGNNIQGVPGIGKKSAGELIERFGSLEAILQAAADGLEGKVGERLREHTETARRCRKLVGLRTDLELGTTLGKLRYRPG